MHHPDRIVERIVIDHEPRMRGAGEQQEQFADGDILLHGDDVGPRHHDAFDPAFAQPKNVLEHGGFGRREAGLRLIGREHELQVGAGRRRSTPAEQNAHDARHPAFAQVAAGLRQDHGQARALGLVGFVGIGDWVIAYRHIGAERPIGFWGSGSNGGLL